MGGAVSAPTLHRLLPELHEVVLIWLSTDDLARLEPCSKHVRLAVSRHVSMQAAARDGLGAGGLLEGESWASLARFLALRRTDGRPSALRHGTCAGAVFSGGLAAVTRPGALWTLGYPTLGQLGHGDHIVRVEPTRVLALLAERVVRVSTGAACVAAVVRSGSLYTWGTSEYGQLGHGDEQQQRLPRRVEGFGLDYARKCDDSAPGVRTKERVAAVAFGASAAVGLDASRLHGHARDQRLRGFCGVQALGNRH